MNAWSKLHARMIFNLQNFGISWLACKKNYKVLQVKYKNDQLSNEF